jgi:hypothetical protein
MKGYAKIRCVNFERVYTKFRSKCPIKKRREVVVIEHPESQEINHKYN